MKNRYGRVFIFGIAMLHLFHGYRRVRWERIYLDNGIFGIEVTYAGIQNEGTYFLFPQWDQTSNTFRYYAFDHDHQKEFFLRLLKIQGVWGKIAYPLALAPTKELKQAVDAFDAAYLTRIPGIGIKLAKRVLMELKQDFSVEDIQKFAVNSELFDDIVQSLKSLWFTAAKIKRVLPHCPYPVEKRTLPQVMKRVIDQLS